jgi:putative ABC transport system permease protein
MQILETVRVALDAVVANKMRSLLTMLGVIIGIAAVITMVALGEGAQRSVEEQLQAMGTDVLTVRPGPTLILGVDIGVGRLAVEDAEALMRAPEYIRAVAPEMEDRYQVEHGSSNANLAVVGTWPSGFGVNNHVLSAGRLFGHSEESGRRRVAVVGAFVAERFGLPSPAALVGQEIRIRGISFEVVGTLREKGPGPFSPDENVYIPLSTAQSRVMGSDRLRSIAVQTVSEQAMPSAMAEIDRVLRREHKLRPGVEADFNIRDNASLMETFQQTTRTFTFLLAGVAAISLLVGGIGIMNIMLVSVTERTREIGLRKSLGARRQDILLQFLIEAVVLCLAGGALGLALGFGGSFALERMAGWSMAVAPNAVVVALLFSAGVGIFFGLWPAQRAARLEPIEALRYE